MYRPVQCLPCFLKGIGTKLFLFGKGHPMRKLLISTVMTVAFQGHQGNDQEAWSMPPMVIALMPLGGKRLCRLREVLGLYVSAFPGFYYDM